MDSNSIKEINSHRIFDHKPGLFVLFFTEMWERFSYYGMRALFVLFLTSTLIDGGFGWDKSSAQELYGIYTAFVYFTPLIGGIIADRLLGYRNAVVAGAIIMTAGHAVLAFETPVMFYTGLALLILGNGLFKPNISSIVGQLYKKDPEKKDGAYTIFYMGINAGAFLGILLCGYIGENISWSYGFGLAGIFMFVGALQFYFGQGIFGKLGLLGSGDAADEYGTEVEETPDSTQTQTIIEQPEDNTSSIRGLRWGIIGLIAGALVAALVVQLSVEGGLFNGEISLFEFFGENPKELMAPIIFGAVIGFIGWIVSDPTLKGVDKDRVWVIVILSFFTIFFWWAFEQAGSSMTIFARDFTARTLEGGAANFFRITDAILTIGPVAVITYVLVKLFGVTFKHISLSNAILGIGFAFVWFLVIWRVARNFSGSTTEVDASWFGILNSFFIITFAPLFSKIWASKVINSGPVKFAIGLFLLAFGFGLLAFGSSSIPAGAETAAVSMVWLIFAYLFHTLGELCVSPVGLSYVSKLAPVRIVGLMFGVFFIANFVANYSAGKTASYIDPISEEKGLSFFFLIFTVIPAAMGVVLLLLNKRLKKMMHGIE